MKHKVGDRVRIVARECGHPFLIGSIVQIIIKTNFDYCAEGNDTKFGRKFTGWVNDSEIEEYIEVKPNKFMAIWNKLSKRLFNK